MQFGFSIYGAWWFSLIYLIFAFGLWFIFPKYVQVRFNKVANLGIINKLYYLAYLLLILSSIVVPLSGSIYLISGGIFFVIGLSLFIAAIYQFAITDVLQPAVAGVYAWCRHPVYLGFAIMWYGVSLATLNIVLFLLISAISYFSYIIANEEEKACLNQYGDDYIKYKNRVNFIFGKK